MVWDPIWEQVFIENEWGKYPSEQVIRFVARNFYQVPDRKRIRLLEVGCGPGANLVYMAHEGFTVYGIEGSATATAKAQKRLDQECPGWNGGVFQGDIRELPFEDGFFDAIIDNEAIYCNSYEDSKKIYDELARVCKKGGKLYSRAAAAGCWGDKTGQKVGHNAWIVTEGPCLGKGYSRFSELEEIPDLITGFGIDSIELLTLTANNRANTTMEWIITGLKNT